jgi:hypothetical protein
VGVEKFVVSLIERCNKDLNAAAGSLGKIDLRRTDAG